MSRPARNLEKLVWLALPIGVAIWRLSEWWRLSASGSWAYYLGEPLPAFWLIVLGLCTLAFLRATPGGWLRAGVFVWLAVIYGLLPTQAGSMAAHPDYFLEEAIDRVSDQIYRARQTGTLPTHSVDLHRLLQPSGSLHYRRGDQRSVPIELRLHLSADGPVLEPGDRPGLIHVAIEGSKKRIWITASSLGFARFSAPVILPDRQGVGPAIVQLLGREKPPSSGGKKEP